MANVTAQVVEQLAYLEQRSWPSANLDAAEAARAIAEVKLVQNLVRQLEKSEQTRHAPRIAALEQRAQALRTAMERLEWDQAEQAQLRKRRGDRIVLPDQSPALSTAEQVDSPASPATPAAPDEPVEELFPKQAVKPESFEQFQDRVTSNMLEMARAMKLNAASTHELLSAGNTVIEDAITSADQSSISLNEALSILATQMESAGGIWAWVLMLISILAFIVMVVVIKLT